MIINAIKIYGLAVKNLKHGSFKLVGFDTTIDGPPLFIRQL